MQPNHLQDSSTLLTYSLVTTPMPVQVSPSATNPSLANLTFVVSCPRSTGTATVAQIIIALPVDEKGKTPDPTNLAGTAPPLSSASIASSGADQWVIAAGVAPGVFVFTPKTDPVKVSAQSLTIEFTGIQVNTLVGTALVKISEWAAPGTGTPPPVKGPPSATANFAVAKFPYGFYAGNFTAEQPMIENGQRPTLSWAGSTNATYKILWDTNKQDVSNIRTWSPSSTPPSPILTHMTTFILQVSAQEGGQTATVDFSITIEVDKPSLIANDLTVLTTTAIGTGGLGLSVNAGGNVGIGTNTTGFPLGFANALGDKIALWGQSGNHYGFGIQGGLLQIHTDGNGSDVAFGYGSSGSFTETMRAKGDGSVGIGTTTTTAMLDVSGTTRLRGTPGATDGSGLTVDGNGDVGIGTNTPSRGKVEIRGYSSNAIPNSVMFDFDNCAVQRGSGQSTISLYADQLIAAQNFLCFSDERIKNIEGISDSARDLQTLLGIEVTDFRYKDVIGKGSAPHKKVVAQQVETVFPQAVSMHTDVVPDVYRQASFVDGWIVLATDLKQGERVRLISDKAEGVYEVLEVTQDKFRTDFKPEGDKVFVFGREVNDFRNLDYDAIAMLNVSATQQLKKEKDEEVTALKAANDALLKRLEKLENRLGGALGVTAAKAASVNG